MRNSTRLAPIALSLTVGCGGPALETSLDLPQALEARIEMLNDLLTEQPDSYEAQMAEEAAHQQMEAQLGLVHRLDLGQGRSLVFFEPEPGMRLIMEEGPQDLEAEALGDVLDTMGFAEAYRYVHPDGDVPQILQDVDARAIARAAPPPQDAEASPVESAFSYSESQPEDHGIAQSVHGLTASQFLNMGGCPSSDLEFCLLNWANGAYGYANANRAWFRLSPVSGSVLFRLEVGGQWKGSWSALQGGYYHWHWNMGSTQTCIPLIIPYCFTTYHKAVIRGDVLNASGDVFHYGGAFDQ